MIGGNSDAPLNVFAPCFRVEECLAEIRQCLEKGWTGLGYKTVEFEEAWKRYTGLPHAHFVHSATAGLHMAVAILKKYYSWEDGDEIITTPLTFVSTNHAILYERMKPVFADVDEYLCLDPESVESLIGPRTQAVMFMGYGGGCGRLEKIQNLCRNKKIPLILDAAHMAGTRVNGRHVGIGVDAAVFSFHSVKNLPTADGGMVCFPDPHLDSLARKASWMGINKDTYSRMGQEGTYKWLYDVEFAGWKYHGNSIMAALGLVGLKYLDQDNAYRRQIARWYHDLLDKRGLLLALPEVPPECESSTHIFPIRTHRRDELMVYLNSANIFPGVHYRINTDYGMYSGDKSLPKAEEAAKQLMSLPCHVKMTRADVVRVCFWIEEFFRKKS